MAFSFIGKRALVTGASQGIGREVAKSLAKCGAQVIAVNKNQEKLENLKSEVPSMEIVTVDLCDWKATENALKNVGDVDLLVNSAGCVMLQPIFQLTEDAIDKSFGINVKALIHCTKLITKNLLARKAPGSIVNISSQASMAGLPDHGVYCATKGAVDAFTRCAAFDLGPHNIRVNAVNPTVVLTELGRLAWSDPTRSGPMLRKIPMGRFAEVNEVVDAVLYLLSDRSSMITGACLPVDGGFLAC